MEGLMRDVIDLIDYVIILAIVILALLLMLLGIIVGSYEITLSGAFILAVLVFVLLVLRLFFYVRIEEDKVGIVVRKRSRNKLPSGQLIALNGEAGCQADTLAPGTYLRLCILYAVEKVPATVVPPGEIGLVIANDGQPIPPDRILGRKVDCDNFQDARKFLKNDGQKGRQLAILTAGTYHINTRLFTVITHANAREHKMSPDLLRVTTIEPDKVGIARTHEGVLFDPNDIAGLPAAPGHTSFRVVGDKFIGPDGIEEPIITKHSYFQDAEEFIRLKGRRGLQMQVLPPGSWNLNTWFVRVEPVEMTEIPKGKEGVVTYKGEEVSRLTGPGKYAVNTQAMKVDIV
jgi:uncharacterized membrane protein YqiK